MRIWFDHKKFLATQISCFKMWKKYSIIRIVTCFVSDWISVLNKSVKWIIQCCTHKDSHLFNSWMNHCFEHISWGSDSVTQSYRQSFVWILNESVIWTNQMSEWINVAPIKTVTCLILEWIIVLNISVEGGTQWLNYKYIFSLNRKWISVLFASVQSMSQWFAHNYSHLSPPTGVTYITCRKTVAYRIHTEYCQSCLPVCCVSPPLVPIFG